jgi:hypothetical protein
MTALEAGAEAPRSVWSQLLRRPLAVAGLIVIAVTVLAAAKADGYEAPFGPLGIHAETNHAILTPHIARAGAAGAFEVVASTERPIVPDPYLARSGPVAVRRPAASPETGADALRAPHLRLVK